MDRLRAEIERLGPTQAITLPVDLAVAGATCHVFAAAEALDTDLLVNAAGFGLGGFFLEHALDKKAAMIEVNCRALMELTHRFGARFAAQRRGGIILFSSIVGGVSGCAAIGESCGDQGLHTVAG